MDSHCRVRAPGAAQPADCPPPTTQHAALAARLGHARLHTLYDQATWSEGPAWWEAQRTLVWSDVVGRRVLGWREDGAVDVLLDATAFTNGNAVANSTLIRNAVEDLLGEDFEGRFES
ncbi:hypothetical protein XocBAI15_10095, partial [Xanthomonas oryzae pv. oryzicola]